MKLFNEMVTDAFKYLESIEVPFPRCRELHHTEHLVSGYGTSITYWEVPRKFEPQNIKYGLAIIALAFEHQQALTPHGNAKKAA